MFSFLTAGMILGLSAGFSPGPLLALVVSETLQHDIRAGIKIAFAPIVTDIPIIIIALTVLAKLSGFQYILGPLSIAGALFILSLGIKNIRTKRVELNLNMEKEKSLQKGVIVNALSPYPYLFWISVGGPTTIKAMETSLLAAISFIGSFYVLLVGAKIILAILVGRSRSFLLGKTYIFTMRLLGFLLILLALFIFRDGLLLLGIL